MEVPRHLLGLLAGQFGVHRATFRQRVHGARPQSSQYSIETRCREYQDVGDAARLPRVASIWPRVSLLSSSAPSSGHTTPCTTSFCLVAQGEADAELLTLALEGRHRRQPAAGTCPVVLRKATCEAWME